MEREYDINSTDEIEVTATMVEAGKAILRTEPSVFAGPFGVDCDAGDLVAKVYRAMARARPSLTDRAKRRNHVA